MKAGVAVALKLAAALPAPSRDVTYVFYDCEEIEAERNGLLRLSRSHPDWLAGRLRGAMEPTDGVIEGGCQGTLRAQIIVPGQARAQRQVLVRGQRRPRRRPCSRSSRLRAPPARRRRAGVPRGAERGGDHAAASRAT